MNEIVIECWGDFACFTIPSAKVERLTYPCPTPSAMRGLLSSIYSKPLEYYWQIRRIEVLNPIRYISFKRNEVKSTVSDKPIYTDDERTQRQTVVLKNVRYRVAASIIPTPVFQDKEKCLVEQALRRIRTGKCFLQPSFGLREFAAYFEEYAPSPEERKPIPESMDLGLMVYDVFDYVHCNTVQKKTKPSLYLFRAVMENGVIRVPPYESPEVLKGVNADAESPV